MASAVLKELHRLMGNLYKLTDGQAEIEVKDPYDNDEADLLVKFLLYISPKDGLYAGARISFEVTVTDSYPYDAPQVQCLNDVLHPNIQLSDEGGDICVSTMSDWEEGYGLDDCVVGILFLFYNPNPDDPLRSWPNMNDEASFAEDVRNALSGDIVHDHQFVKLLIDDKDNAQVVPEKDTDGKKDEPKKEEIIGSSDNVRVVENDVKSDEMGAGSGVEGELAIGGCRLGEDTNGTKEQAVADEGQQEKEEATRGMKSTEIMGGECQSIGAERMDGNVDYGAGASSKVVGNVAAVGATTRGAVATVVNDGNDLTDHQVIATAEARSQTHTHGDATALSNAYLDPASQCPPAGTSVNFIGVPASALEHSTIYTEHSSAYTSIALKGCNQVAKVFLKIFSITKIGRFIWKK